MTFFHQKLVFYGLIEVEKEKFLDVEERNEGIKFILFFHLVLLSLKNVIQEEK